MQLSKTPDCDHWAIITESTIYIPGDERSRTNPGHGYSATTEQVIKYDAYTDYNSFELDCIRLTKTNKKFKVMKVVPLTIKTNITIVE